MARQTSNQTGAQDQGIAISGKAGAINTGTQINSTTQPQQQISGNANQVSYTTTQNGLNADDLSGILGKLSAPTPTQVSAATPPALTVATPDASITKPAATMPKKNYLIIGGLALAALAAFYFGPKLFKR